MAPYFMNIPIPVERIMDVYRLLGAPQPPRPPVPAYDPFGVAERRQYQIDKHTEYPDNEFECEDDEPVAVMVPLERPRYGIAPLPEDYAPTKPRAKRAKPRCKEVKMFGTKKVRCLKNPGHDGRHSWMDRAE